MSRDGGNVILGSLPDRIKGCLRANVCDVCDELD